jgi:hypothetical protein
VPVLTRPLGHPFAASTAQPAVPAVVVIPAPVVFRGRPPASVAPYGYRWRA